MSIAFVPIFCRAQIENRQASPATPAASFASTGSAMSPASADELAEALSGIAHYTRWPESTLALQLCVDTANDPAAMAIVRKFAEAAPGPHLEVVSRNIGPGAIASLLGCQAIFFGNASPAVWRPLLVELLNHPILTVGYGDDFCSYGGLFCLDPIGPRIRIKANLDSISRSGLRVNPQLLRLTQREGSVR